jgi:hypothetical protein
MKRRRDISSISISERKAPVTADRAMSRDAKESVIEDCKIASPAQPLTIHIRDEVERARFT